MLAKNIALLRLMTAPALRLCGQKTRAFAHLTLSRSLDNEFRLARASTVDPFARMSESTLTTAVPSLFRRRVRYSTGSRSCAEGIVTHHHVDSGTVIVMDLDDGSFWRGQEELIEVIV